MLKLRRESQLDKAKTTLRDAVSYADEIIRDEQLRGNLLAAIGHGVEAGDRVVTDIEEGGIASRLAADKKLRRKLRATLDDLDEASERLRRKQRHRFRNAVLIVAGVGAVVIAAPSVRRWLRDTSSEPATGPLPAT